VLCSVALTATTKNRKLVAASAISHAHDLSLAVQTLLHCIFVAVFYYTIVCAHISVSRHFCHIARVIFETTFVLIAENLFFLSNVRVSFF
jgi:hypothetical protein